MVNFGGGTLTGKEHEIGFCGVGNALDLGSGCIDVFIYKSSVICKFKFVHFPWYFIL